MPFKMTPQAGFWQHLKILFVWMPLPLLMLLPQLVLANPYYIEVSKSKRLLLVKKDDQIIKQYAIAHGKGGRGTKRLIGDNKTPVGKYRVIEFKSDSKFHFFIQLDYPNMLDAWYGYKNEVINASDFKRIAIAYKNRDVPPQSTRLGGYIGIHGIGEMTDKKAEIHKVHNWTEGCIAVLNNEILEIKELVRIGTRVIITE